MRLYIVGFIPNMLVDWEGKGTILQPNQLT